MIGRRKKTPQYIVFIDKCVILKPARMEECKIPKPYKYWLLCKFSQMPDQMGIITHLRNLYIEMN